MNLFGSKDRAASKNTHVVISGAGPAGLLLTSLLLQRNETHGTNYKVTLLEKARQDLGKLNPETELSKHRSWMLALAGHGLEAIREIPELYADHVNGVGVRLRAVSIWLGTKEIKSDAGQEGEDNEGYIIDRNFVCAAISRYVNHKHSDNLQLDMRYGTKLMYVDSDNQRVLIRKEENGQEEYMNYDLLIGADGIRSVVREAIAKKHFDFEYDVGDIFQCFKAVHVKCPAKLASDTMHLLPSCLPKMTGIGLPETGGLLNISIGVPRHLFDGLPEEVKSDDPAVVAKFFMKYFKAFELDDYDDFAKQWVAQRWNRTGQAHCNFYHSSPLKIIIMGDAAHATSPSIGMGMNTALRDAQALYKLLDEHNDDLEKVLPAFSEARVKEGNSLTDLAMHLYVLDDFHQLIETVHMVLRSFLAKYFPFVTDHPQSFIGNPKYNLCDVYASAVKLGIIRKHRRINARVRRDYFERKTGMVVDTHGISSVALGTTLCIFAAAAGVMYKMFI